MNGRNPSRRHRFLWAIVLAAIPAMAAIGGLGCTDDPASKKRIAQRWEAFDDTALEMREREVDGIRRTHEDINTAKGWWEEDVKTFNETLPQVGDYFW